MRDAAIVDNRSFGLIGGLLGNLNEPQQDADRLEMLIEAIECLPIQTGITISDIHGKIIYANAIGAEMHGYAMSELIGRDEGALAATRRELPGTVLRPESSFWKREAVNLRKDGAQFPVELCSIAVLNARGRCIAVVTACEDITGRKNSQKQIEHLAFFDMVTKLPNRTLLMDRLHQALALAHREGRELALLLLDIDDFKHLNETQGHEAGDVFLRDVATRLSACIPESSTLARVGGDEFVILLSSQTDEEAAAGIAREVQSLFDHPFRIGEQQFHSSASIGIAMYPEDGPDAESLLKCADAAMYHAKSEGKSNYQFFSKELNSKITRRLVLENGMRQGLARGEFSLHYQPQWDLASDRLAGVEALLRWKSPELGSVPPDEFIPVAELSGLIFELGELALRSACQQARSWSEEHPDLKVAVNISGRQFRQPDFLETVGRVIEETAVPPSALELEFTESVIMEKAERNIDALRALKRMGVSLSIDDFGTGYSSLNYLKHFPIDAIKIDRSFIAEVECNSDDAAITEAIISMGHSLKLRVVAEGVENGSQLEFLRERSCDGAQGFLLALPMPAAELTALLKRPHGAGQGASS